MFAVGGAVGVGVSAAAVGVVSAVEDVVGFAAAQGVVAVVAVDDDDRRSGGLGIDSCAGNLHIFGDTADFTCEATSGIE